MGVLRSKMLAGDPPLEDCAVRPAAHLYQSPRTRGPHVRKVQHLVCAYAGVRVSKAEWDKGEYGPTTAAAVLQYKTIRNVLGPGQKVPDNVVGVRTIIKLDDELYDRLVMGETVPLPPYPYPSGEAPSDPPPAPAGAFKFVVPALPLLLKSSSDGLSTEDLENAPVSRSAAAGRARLLAAGGNVLVAAVVTEGVCKRNLLSLAGRGGVQAREMAEFFLTNTNRPPGFVRAFGPDHFWATTMAGDRAFTANHARMASAIRRGLQQLADRSGQAPKVASVDQLPDGRPNQPPALAQFANDISFAFQKDPQRALDGDPLAFGFGGIQGLEVRLTRFAGKPDGSFDGDLQYVLFDHYGSNDSDVIDPGQAGLWLLQRKMAVRQGRIGFEPYRVKVTVDGVKFTGQLV